MEDHMDFSHPWDLKVPPLVAEALEQNRSACFIYAWQYKMLGGFFAALMDAVCCADSFNLARLEQAFPGEIRAFRLYSHTPGWWEAQRLKLITLKTWSENKSTSYQNGWVDATIAIKEKIDLILNREEIAYTHPIARAIFEVLDLSEVAAKRVNPLNTALGTTERATYPSKSGAKK